MITHTLHTHTYLRVGGCERLCALAHMFDATLHMSSWHDHTYLRVGGCERLCALAHMFDATLRMSSWHDHTYLRVGDVNIFVHLLTCSMLRSTPLVCMIVHTANIFHATLRMSFLHDYCRRSTREVRRQHGTMADGKLHRPSGWGEPKVRGVWRCDEVRLGGCGRCGPTTRRQWMPWWKHQKCGA